MSLKCTFAHHHHYHHEHEIRKWYVGMCFKTLHLCPMGRVEEKCAENDKVAEMVSVTLWRNIEHFKMFFFLLFVVRVCMRFELVVKLRQSSLLTCQIKLDRYQKRNTDKSIHDCCMNNGHSLWFSNKIVESPIKWFVLVLTILVRCDSINTKLLTKTVWTGDSWFISVW